MSHPKKFLWAVNLLILITLISFLIAWINSELLRPKFNFVWTASAYSSQTQYYLYNTQTHSNQLISQAELQALQFLSNQKAPKNYSLRFQNTTPFLLSLFQQLTASNYPESTQTVFLTHNDDSICIGSIPAPTNLVSLKIIGWVQP